MRRITRKTSEGASLSFVLPANSPPASPQPPSPIPEEVETTALNGEGRLMEDVQNEMAFEEDEHFGDKEE